MLKTKQILTLMMLYCQHSGCYGKWVPLPMAKCLHQHQKCLPVQNGPTSSSSPGWTVAWVQTFQWSTLSETLYIKFIIMMQCIKYVYLSWRYRGRETPSQGRSEATQSTGGHVVIGKKRAGVTRCAQLCLTYSVTHHNELSFGHLEVWKALITTQQLDSFLLLIKSF